MLYGYDLFLWVNEKIEDFSAQFSLKDVMEGEFDSMNEVPRKQLKERLRNRLQYLYKQGKLNREAQVGPKNRTTILYKKTEI